MARLLIVDSVRTPQRGLAAVLEKRPDIEVVGVATSVEEALAHLSECDTLLVSATLPGGGALLLLQAAIRSERWISTLIMDVSRVAGAATQFVDAGAAGWVL